ncbi:MAG: tetratricopeptide repeat protein [Armatimonadetes bacterium]|nr:tetratricopeptide repeat protein [Armatimonadota bacterium]
MRFQMFRRGRIAHARAVQAARLGQELVGQGRLEEAVVEFERALELQPTLLEARVNLGATWYRMAAARAEGAPAGWLREASKHFQFVLGLQPENVPAALGLAAAHDRLGESDQALGILEPLARAHPQTRDVHYNLALVYARRGEREAAVAAVEKELAAHPGRPRPRSALGAAWWTSGGRGRPPHMAYERNLLHAMSARRRSGGQ